MPTGTELLLWIIMILSNAFYAMSAPFLPVIFEQKSISLDYVGVVFASFSVALIIFSPMVTGWIEKFGQPNLLGFGLGLMGVSTFAFAYAMDFEEEKYVIGVSLVLRFIQGIAGAILNTASYSFASLLFPNKHKLESAIQMLEATASLGLILGPIIGSSIYTWLGFKGAFVLLGVALIPLAIVMNCIFVKVRNDSVEEEQLLEPLLADGNRAKSAMPPSIGSLEDSASE